jgi:hypothetical protein
MKAVLKGALSRAKALAASPQLRPFEVRLARAALLALAGWLGTKLGVSADHLLTK